MQSRNLPPVLGLCAPNAKFMESSRAASKSNKKNKHGMGLEFPFNLAPFSGPGPGPDVDAKPHGTTDIKMSLPSFNPVCYPLENV